ncbi:hypothetical protein NLM24_30800 [Nocardia zapadnayensis]|uniref:hypothetical protein n=1 Tax=Nocardia rhamnosiphila TaxID=426716 RepID=UPI002246CF04|nr:hypothetical protein [Nocardia zapadnayensis]MCX0275006.1 hypothetical protein [Nocardia zapadnayensis]
MHKALLTVAALYLAVIGLALLLVPTQFGVGAVPEDASPELIALLRLLGGPFLGIALLNWMSRTLAPATIRNTVLLADLTGFGVVALNDVWGVLSGEARDVAAVFGVVHLAFAAAFLLVWWRARPAAA